MDEPKVLVLDELAEFEWDREVDHALRAVDLSSARLESARANLLMTALIATSAIDTGEVFKRTPRSAVGPRGYLCENCNGRRSPEANYCPRCGHQRPR